VGDLLAQSFEKEEGGSAPKAYDWERAAVFMLFGTFLAGPVCVYNYDWFL
jgi:hypothetical protein